MHKVGAADKPFFWGQGVHARARCARWGAVCGPLLVRRAQHPPTERPRALLLPHRHRVQEVRRKKLLLPTAMMPPRLPTACLKALLVLVILAAGGGTAAAAEFPAMTDATFRPAFKEYLADPVAAAAKHGPIEQWDVSGVTKMEQLFMEDNGSEFPGADTFDADISAWNTGNVVSMHRMFMYARALTSQSEASTPPP